MVMSTQQVAEQAEAFDRVLISSGQVAIVAAYKRLSPKSDYLTIFATASHFVNKEVGCWCKRRYSASRQNGWGSLPQEIFAPINGRLK